MKSRNHKVPEERNKDRLEDLRSENRKLRKEVTQLRKEAHKLKNRDEGLQDLFEEFRDIEQEVKSLSNETKFECPHCHSTNTRLMSLRFDNSHYTCIDCGKTGPKNAK